MSGLEVAAVVLLAVALGLQLVPARRRPRAGPWLALAGGLLLVVVAAEGRQRWQLEPIEGVAAALVVAGLWRLRRGEPVLVGAVVHAGVVLLAFLGLGLLAAGTLLAAGLPLFSLPEPSGPHAVGRARIAVVDAARPERFSADPDDRRELLVELWYPAQALPGREPLAYDPYARSGGPHRALLLREAYGMQLFDRAFDHHALVPSHGVRDAPPARSPRRFPVLVYSHGYGVAGPSSNTVLLEELASHGYFVAAIAHPYETPWVRFPDGRVVPGDVERIASLSSEVPSEEFEARMARYDETGDPAERDAQIAALLAETRSATESLAVWTADTVTVVDELARMDAGEVGSSFAGRLDLERLGVLGMSFGGATAARFCVLDARCRAGANLDGLMYGEDMATAVVPVPFLNLVARRGRLPMNEYVERHASGDFRTVQIDDATHANFTDTSITSPLMRWLGGLGAIDGHEMLARINAEVLAFFDRNLAEAGAAPPDRSPAG